MAASAVEPVKRQQTPDAEIKIIPTLELMSAVLSYSAWVDEVGPQAGGNDYHNRLSAQFSDYSDHDALAWADKLLEFGFRHDAWVNLAFRLEADENLSVRHPYDASITRRAGGEENLEMFRTQLADFATSSDFFEFFAQNRGYYEDLIDTVDSELDAETLVDWLGEFYGFKGDRYVTILAPALSPAGGYGGPVITGDGELVMLNVMRAADERGSPRFKRGESLANLALHEWSHSYVDPILAEYAEEVAELHFLFEPVQTQMRDQAYENVYVFVNEQVLRSIVSLAMKDLYGESAYRRDIASNEQRGFYMTEHIAEFIEENYRRNRGEYSHFGEFAPEVIEEMKELDPDEFNINRWPLSPGAVRPLFLGAVTIIAMIWWVVIGFRRRRQQIEQMEDYDYFHEQ